MVGGRRFLALVALGALLLGACGDDDATEPQRATVPTAEPTTTTTAAAPSTTTEVTSPPADFEALAIDPALTPEQQVEAAYLHSWDIYLDALRTGRTDYLALAHRGDALDLRVDEINRLVADGKRVEGHVDHDHVIEIYRPDLAVVTDRARNHLVLVDDGTGEPLEPDPNTVTEYRYSFVIEDERWLLAFVE